MWTIVRLCISLSRVNNERYSDEFTAELDTFVAEFVQDLIKDFRLSVVLNGTKVLQIAV